MDWTYRLRLRHLEMLRSLIDTRNISRSAEVLNTTQPALSKWLKDLETDLGLPLFDRLGRGLRPTRYCTALADHARRIVAHLDAARDDMAALREGGAGRIVIGTSGASLGSTAPLAVLALMRLYPDAAMELVEGPIARLLERLGAGEIDVVVGRAVAEDRRVGLRQETLYEEPIAFIVRPGHPLLQAGDDVGEAVMRHRWIVWPKGTPIRETLDASLAASGRAVPPLSVQSSTATLNLTLMGNSDLVCLASERDARRYVAWGLARILPLALARDSGVAMYWRDDGDARPMLAAALRSLRAAAREEETSAGAAPAAP